MDRDELIKKYKGVLGILSKAKKAKEGMHTFQSHAASV